MTEVLEEFAGPGRVVRGAAGARSIGTRRRGSTMSEVALDVTEFLKGAFAAAMSTNIDAQEAAQYLTQKVIDLAGEINEYVGYEDPGRIDEDVVRGMVPRLFGSAGELMAIKQGRFIPGGRDSYASVEVLACRPIQSWGESAYSVHTMVIPHGPLGLEKAPYAQNGEYDLTVREANKRLAER